MKKETSPILVVCTIIVLLLIIILPPVFRVYIPKEEKINQTKDTQEEKNTMLTCTKTSTTEQYTVTSSVNYIGNKPMENKITYIKTIDETKTKDEVVPTVNEENNPVKTITEEYNFFASIQNIEKETINNQSTFIINNETLDLNPELQELANYLQDIDSEEEYYVSQGYTCTKNSSQ